VNARKFFSELKRRKVYRVAAAYAVVAWLLIQVVTQTFPFLEIPNSAIRLVIVLVVLGFPLALVLSWLFDLTPRGFERTDDEAQSLSGSHVITSRSRAAMAIPEKSIAVLPFENLSDDPRNAYFADGVHDDILTSLAKIADLKVISRTSVQQYKTGTRNLPDIAEALGVAHILEGTVRRVGNRIRVNAQLINAQADAHVWGESFDRELTDLFAIQTELAERITLALRAKISPREKASLQVRPTTDLGAYELYLRARELFQWSGVGDAQENGERALPLLEQAVQRDPRFALAYALLSRVHAELYWFGCDKRAARLDAARSAAETALDVQPGLGEAHLALGFYHYYKDRDYKQACAQLDEALQATPNDSEVIGAMGVIDRRQAKWEQSIAHLERARELDPRNVATIWNLAETYAYCRSYDDADAVLADGLAVSPDAHFFSLARASLALRRDGDPGPLRDAIRKLPADFDPGGAVTALAVRVALMHRDCDEAARRLAGSSHNWCNDNGLSGMAGALDGYTIPRAWYEGLIARARGDADAAQRAFIEARVAVEKDFEEWSSDEKTVMMLALVHAALGNRDDAIRHARHAAELLPVARDALDGPLIATNLAVVYARLGEHDLALAELERLASARGGPSPGLLRAEPEWDPLRGNPRFRQLAGL
jgi:TolB-like protein/Flp pilus assembly protein TadD